MQLGHKAVDKITGFQGIVTGKASYITGCDQYLVNPPVRDGNFIEGKWFDEGRLGDLGLAISPQDVQTEENGCDATAPIK